MWQKKVAMLDDTLLGVWLHWAKRREAAVSRLNELFVAHDTNKDGRLDIAEFKALIAALCAQEHVPEPSRRRPRRSTGRRWRTQLRGGEGAAGGCNLTRGVRRGGAAARVAGPDLAKRQKTLAGRQADTEVVGGSGGC